MKGFKKIVYIYNVLWDGFYYLFVFYRFWFRGCWRSCFGIFLWIVFFCLARRRFRVGACLFLGLGCLGDSIELLYFLIRWILRGWLRIYFYIYFILIKDWVIIIRKNVELYKNCIIYVIMYYSKVRNKSYVRIRGGGGREGFGFFWKNLIYILNLLKIGLGFFLEKLFGFV